MQIFHVILDHPLVDGRAARSGSSLITSAFGTNTLLQYLMRRLTPDRSRHLAVIPLFEPSTNYEHRIERCADGRVSIVPSSRSRTWLRGLEPSDWLLIADPQCWPLEDDSSIPSALEESEFAGATYWVATRAEQGAAREIIQHDQDGNVRSIMRCFGPVVGPASAPATIPFALVPVWALDELSCPSLSHLRKSLLQQEVACRDLPLHGEVLDLSREECLLSLHDRAVHRAARDPLPHRYSMLAPGVLVGPGAVIHSTARIIPPAIFQEQVTIERGATIVGPVVVARGSRVDRDVFVARSIIPSDSLISSDVAICNSSRLGLMEGLDDADGDPTEPGIAAVTPPRPYPQDSFGPALWDAETESSTNVGVKRAIDFTVAAASLILLLPLLLILALWVRLDSRGPVLFAHEREGHGGRRFRCYKFRTMRPDAHELQRELYKQNMVDGPQFKLVNDPRVTFAGRFLRSNNLDELPQLINVLLGHMSLVGPRPSPFRENQICIPWRRGRLSVRPGITGLWQICRSDRAAGDFQQWIYYDLIYVRHQSLWLDLKILLATVLTLGGRREVPLGWLVKSESQPHGLVAT